MYDLPSRFDSAHRMTSGSAGYVHLEGIDQPIGLIRPEGTRVINYTWRGLGESSVFTNGVSGDCAIPFSNCAPVQWPGKTQAGVYFTPNLLASGPSGPYTWFGTLAENGGGSTGMLFRRNRYFDPVSGRFTQQDPIGVAGGMNLYGFADGDPVNFADPFGLCTPKPLCPREMVRPGGFAGAILNAIGQGALQLREEYGDDVLNIGFALIQSRSGGAGRGGFNSRTVGRVTIGRTQARVDVELPGKHGPGNVHVQTKGPGGPAKYPIATPDDLSGLPGKLRENQTVQRAIAKAFELLERFKP